MPFDVADCPLNEKRSTSGMDHPFLVAQLSKRGLLVCCFFCGCCFAITKDCV